MVAIRLLVALVAESGGSATFRHFAVAAKLGGLASIEAEGNAAHPGGRTSPMVAGLLATWSPRACHGRSLKAELGRLGQHQSRGALRGASGGARRPPEPHAEGRTAAGRTECPRAWSPSGHWSPQAPPSPRSSVAGQAPKPVGWPPKGCRLTHFRRTHPATLDAFLPVRPRTPV